MFLQFYSSAHLLLLTLIFYRILSWCPLLGVNTEERKKSLSKIRRQNLKNILFFSTKQIIFRVGWYKKKYFRIFHFFYFPKIIVWGFVNQQIKNSGLNLCFNTQFVRIYKVWCISVTEFFYSKQWGPWYKAAFWAISSGSSLFAEVPI